MVVSEPVDKSVDKMWISFDAKSYPHVRFRRSDYYDILSKTNQEVYMANPIVIPAQDKPRFTVKQLAEAFGTSSQTVRKMLGDTPPIGKRETANVWLLKDVSELKDVRDPYIPQAPDEEAIETDPDKMKPSDRRTHYQAEDLKQAAELTARKNDLERRGVIPSIEVEQALAQAFKSIALLLDTLPDALERDGMIASSDIHSIIAIVDSAREQLANDLTKLSPIVEEINESEDW